MLAPAQRINVLLSLPQDTGYPSYNTSKSIKGLVENGKVDAVFLNGDISYANGYIAVWQYYLNMVSDFSSKVAFLNTIGNHEIDGLNIPGVLDYGSSGGGECGVLSTTLLPFPDEKASLARAWWSYDVGYLYCPYFNLSRFDEIKFLVVKLFRLIHFVGMSTEHNFSIGSEQFLWIENDLRSVDRSVTPWVIFGGHRSMYINSNQCCKSGVACGSSCFLGSDQGVSAMLQESMEPLLYKYRVNVAFSGHLHEIQRQSAVYAGGTNSVGPDFYIQTATMVDSVDIPEADSVSTYDGPIALHDDPQATIYMIIGTAGQGFQERPMAVTPVWNEAVILEYGYGVVTAVNATCLIWETIRSADDSVIDKMVIIQSLSNMGSSFGAVTQSWSLNESFSYKACLLVLFGLLQSIFLYRALFTQRSVKNMSHADVDTTKIPMLLEIREEQKASTASLTGYGAILV